ncbi:MAG TPA: peroxiredoxin [Pseudomonadales bacterium]|nr:peroxiredoxin [Pseudomonadales bacterium]
MKSFRAVFGTLLIFVATSVFAADLKVGDPAPDFKLMGTDGKYHSLSDYKGKQPVILAFFPKAYTHGCTIECKALRDSQKDIEAFDVAYFMTSVDKPEDSKGFAEQNHAKFPILSDPDKTASKAYGVLSSFGVDHRWTFYIDKQGIIQMIDHAVDPKTAGTTLVKNLGELKGKLGLKT